MIANRDDRLDLQTAADELGVHYQTAYRWVRSGRLPAQLVGGRYVVARDVLDAVERDRTTPESPTRPSRSRLDRSADRMYDDLVAGDEASARRIARRLVDEGAPVIELVQHVLTPALVRIGQSWHDGHLSIWTEHRSSAIVERILGDIAPNPRGRRRGTAAVAAVSGDRHALPTTMAAIALRDDQWDVHHLGADIPTDELVDFCGRHEIDLVVITSTNPTTRAAAQAAADRIRPTGPQVLVGGAGRTLDDLVVAARESLRSATG